MIFETCPNFAKCKHTLFRHLQDAHLEILSHQSAREQKWKIEGKKNEACPTKAHHSPMDDDPTIFFRVVFGNLIS